MSGYLCTLFRSQGSDWKGFSQPIRVEVNQSGLAFRISGTHQLLADVPKQAIESMDEMELQSIYLIRSNGKAELAFMLSDSKLGKQLSDLLKRWSYPVVIAASRCSDLSKPQFPDLAEKNVKEYIIKLLFSDEFHDFTDKLIASLDRWSATMKLHP